MAKLESLAHVGIFVTDWAAALRFYTRKIGLKVRDEDRKWDYVALGAREAGTDASLNLWQPIPAWGETEYDAGLKQIGTVTGITFRTRNLEKTAELFERRGVKVEVRGEAGERFGRFTDPDGNALFLVEPERPSANRAGVIALDLVTVVSRDARRAGRFFSKTLGMRRRRDPEGAGFASYRLSSKESAILPFTPTQEMYETAGDYEADLGHIGENTAIGFTAHNLLELQEELMAKGVRFTRKAERRDWGGMQARFLDPDDNVYSIQQV